jgi:uncharacterized membrane protein YccC
VYTLLCAHLPRPLVHALYAVWYAALLLLVYYFFDRQPAGFYYMHR